MGMGKNKDVINFVVFYLCVSVCVLWWCMYMDPIGTHISSYMFDVRAYCAMCLYVDYDG